MEGKQKGNVPAFVAIAISISSAFLRSPLLNTKDEYQALKHNHRPHLVVKHFFSALTLWGSCSNCNETNNDEKSNREDQKKLRFFSLSSFTKSSNSLLVKTTVVIFITPHSLSGHRFVVLNVCCRIYRSDIL